MFLRKKKKNGLDKEKKDQRNSLDEEPEVDSEGYTIRKNVENYNQKNIDKFYSSSDESDSEKEGEKKLHFEIKPRNQNGFDLKNASVDELKQTVKQLSIAPPINTVSPMSASMLKCVCAIDKRLVRAIIHFIFSCSNSSSVCYLSLSYFTTSLSVWQLSQFSCHFRLTLSSRTFTLRESKSILCDQD